MGRKIASLAILLSVSIGNIHGAASQSVPEILNILWDNTNGENWEDKSGWYGQPGSYCQGWAGIQCYDVGFIVQSICILGNNIDILGKFIGIQFYYVDCIWQSIDILVRFIEFLNMSIGNLGKYVDFIGQFWVSSLVV